MTQLPKRRNESRARVQAFKTSFTALAGEKESFFDAAILIFSPLAGLRPSRSGEALTLNFPNPAKETSSSLAAALTMLFSTLARIACACALDMSLASATIVTSSEEFISKFLENRGKGDSIAERS